MFMKLKPVALYISLFSLSFFGLYFMGISTSVFAQDTQAATKEAKPVIKSDTHACRAAAACESKKSYSKQAHTCYHENKCGSKPGCDVPSRACDHYKNCTGKPGCDTPSGKKSGCKKDEGHCVDDLLKIVHCAKKQLLKEKIKANLEEKIGTKLDKVADLLVNTMLEEYKSGRESKERRDALGKKLGEIFSEKAGE